MSGYTIENLLSKSHEGQDTSTSNLNFEKSLSTKNNSKMATYARHATNLQGATYARHATNLQGATHARHATNLERAYAVPFSHEYDHQHITSCNESTVLYGAVGEWRYDTVLSNRPVMLQGRCCCCCSTWNAIRNRVGEQNTWTTEPNTHLQHSPIRASIEASPIAKDPKPELQESQLLITERNKFRNKEKRMGRIYEWMFNPRPFYRKGKTY